MRFECENIGSGHPWFNEGSPIFTQVIVWLIHDNLQQDVVAQFMGPQAKILADVFACNMNRRAEGL